VVSEAAASAAAASVAAVESPLQCLRNTIQREGFKGLYRGCITPCMGAAVEDSISFSVYHTVVRYFGKNSGVGGGRSARPEDLSLDKVFIAGSLGGMTTSFLVTPLELIKCRLQVDRVSKGGGATGFYKGPVDCLIKSVKQEGVRVLYKGHSATFLREGLGTGVFFSTYELGLRSFSPGVPRDQMSTITVLMAGALSGVVLNAVPYPFDTAKSVMQTLQIPSGSAASGSVAMPKGLMGALRLIVETEGIAGLYRGITPALLRAMPTNAAVFLSVRVCSPANPFLCIPFSR